MNSKYYSEHQSTCKITSKLIYFLIDLLEQIKDLGTILINIYTMKLFERTMFKDILGIR